MVSGRGEMGMETLLGSASYRNQTKSTTPKTQLQPNYRIVHNNKTTQMIRVSHEEKQTEKRLVIVK